MPRKLSLQRKCLIEFLYKHYDPAVSITQQDDLIPRSLKALKITEKELKEGQADYYAIIYKRNTL